jgi:WD40 repeat protein
MRESREPTSAAGPVDELLLRWQEGQEQGRPVPPGPSAPSDRLTWLAQLRADQDRRWRRGERVPAERYLARLRGLAADAEAAVDLIFSEFLLREALGEAPRPEEYLARFPAHAEPLRRQFDLHHALQSGGAATDPADTPGRAAEAPAVPPGAPDPAQTTDSPPGEAADLYATRDARHAGPAATRAPIAVPGYEVLGELGRGGMGVVYKARQTGLGRTVALKMVLAGGHAGAQERARFKAEAEAIARLQHPNIVQVHEVGEHQGLPFFSLEFCPGGSLAQKLSGTPLPAAEAARLVETLARAVHAAHEAHVVHRDLKPANVLLATDGTPKVTDFGLAKKLDEAGQTASGAVMGTPSYMAPEQAGGNKEVGPAADVYALGAVLYELLTGRPPFKAASVMDTLMQVLADEPAPPSRLNPGVPRDLETVCLKCLEKGPARRYANAAELAEDLRHFQAGEPIRARPVGVVERAWKWARRRPALAALVAVSLLFVASAVVAGVAFTIHLDTARREADERAEANRVLAEANRALARKEQRARRQADERRVHAEKMALQDRFDHLHFLSRDEPAEAILGWASLLPKAIALRDSSLADSILLQLGGWCREVHELRGVYSHQGQVNAVAFSPDGKTLLTGSRDGTARLWLAANGQPIGQGLRHQGWVGAVAFSPDGRAVVTGSKDGTARLWRAATGRQIGPALRHWGEVLAVAFGPDGRAVLTGSADGTARLWRAETGQPIGPALRHRGWVGAVAFSPDGKAVVTGSHDKAARLWRADTGEPIGPALQHQGPVVAAAFSPDGKVVLTASMDYTARLWRADTGTPIGPALRHQDQVVAAAFSPDGKAVLTAGWDKTARLWRTATGKQLGPDLRHQSVVRAVAFSPDGKAVLTGSGDGTGRLWDTGTGAPLGPAMRHQGNVTAVAFSPDGKAVLTGRTDGTARLWRAETGGQIGPPLAHQGWVVRAAFSPDGKTALTGSNDKTARLWRADTGQPIGAPLRHRGPVWAMAFSPDGKTALTGSLDGTTRLWRADTGQPLGPPLRHPGVVLAVAFSPDGKTVLTGAGVTARLWQAATGKQIGPALRHPGEVGAVAFSPDGKTVLTGCSGGTARLWRADTGQPIGPPLPIGSPLLRNQSTVAAVAFSPDGKTVLTASRDLTGDRGEARLWRADTGQPIGQPLRHQGKVLGGALGPDGKALLIGGLDGTARLWRVDTGQPVGPPLRHQGAVMGGAFSPDGKALLTGSADGTARLWQAATGKQIGPDLRHRAEVLAVAFSPDGKAALTGTKDGTARLWRVGKIGGSPDQILLWTQVITGLEMNERGEVLFLGAAAWPERRRRLQKLGGPPER